MKCLISPLNGFPIKSVPGEGTPSLLGDMDVPPFWPPFLTFWGLNSIFLGYFFSSTNSKAIFWGTKTINFYTNRSFWPQIQFFPRSFWVQFSAAHPHHFSGRVPPPGSQCLLGDLVNTYITTTIQYNTFSVCTFLGMYCMTNLSNRK